jgi:hypothetical protein
MPAYLTFIVMKKLVVSTLILLAFISLNAQTHLQLILTPQFTQPLSFQNNKNTIRIYPAFCGNIGLRKATETANARLHWLWSAAFGTSACNFRYLLTQQDYPLIAADQSNIPYRNHFIPYFQAGLGIGYLTGATNKMRINIQSGLRFYASSLFEYSSFANTTNPPNGQQFLVFDLSLETRTMPFLYLNIQAEKQFSPPESDWEISCGIELCLLQGAQLSGSYRALPGSGSGFSGSVIYNASSIGLFLGVGRKRRE